MHSLSAILPAALVWVQRGANDDSANVVLWAAAAQVQDRGHSCGNIHDIHSPRTHADQELPFPHDA